MAKKKTNVKLNDKVKTNKKKASINIDKYETDEAREVKRFIIILFSIIVVALIVYGITMLINKDSDDQTNDYYTAGEIDYDIVVAGTLFNRSESEYYVIAYNGEDSNAIYYSALINKYMGLENSLKVYFCDLSNALNKEHYVGEDGTSNKNATKASELAFKDLTLIKIKNGKIVKYVETLDTIKTELGI